MCGITGKVSLRGEVDERLIEQMCRTIEHRGPDARGVFVDGTAGLGVQRLAVIDLETGDQPIFNEDRSLVVVLNGEIYNYRELRVELVAAGHKFATDTDTEVIVHLYEDLGDACVTRLRGMFAFALWDTSRHRLLLARDRIGKKPLYFAHRDQTIWFGSEAKAILQDPAVRRDVDYAAIDAFLHYQYVPHDSCAFAALEKVPPAHTLVFEDGRAELSRYWKLSYAHKLRGSETELAEVVREQLVESTRLRLRSDVPLGVFLSGGIDSSAVVAAAALQSSAPLKTFTIGFAADRFDERVYAREIASLFGTDHHELLVEPDLVEILPLLAWHYSEPFADQSAFPSYYLSRLTREHVTVALSGDGGDESFGGYLRYRGNDLARRLDTVPAPLARLGVAALERTGTGPEQDSTRARALRVLRSLPLDPASRYAAWIACVGEADRRDLYTPAALEAVSVSNGTFAAPIEDAYEASDAPTLIERLLDVDTQTYLTDQLLVKMDVASMANSLEVRSPFLDHVFMEVAASLPVEAKIRGRTTKRLLKKAVSTWVPEDFLERPKRGFTMPISAWLRHELRDLPSTVLLDPAATSRGLFRREAVERLIEGHRRGVADNATKLWALIQLELWFRTYIDVSPRGPVALDLEDVRGRDLSRLAG